MDRIRYQQLTAMIITLIASISGIRHADISEAETTANWAWPGMPFYVYDRAWYSCSVGFPAWDSAGNHYFITAGHCFTNRKAGLHYMKDVQHNIGSDIFSGSDRYNPVGFERIYFHPIKDSLFDVSLVQMYPGKSLTGLGWHYIPNQPLEPEIGDEACLVGKRHRQIMCGKIINTNEVFFPNDSRFSETRTVNANYCSQPGDSGGAVFNHRGALGIHVTGNGHCSANFIPIEAILAEFRQMIPGFTM